MYLSFIRRSSLLLYESICVSCCLRDVCFFFFKQKTAYEMRISDWSSDVCSSDLNGAGGIAVGMATNIPPHNLGEVIRACLAYIDNTGITIDELIQIVPGPDFRTAPFILGQSGARSAYHTGLGSTRSEERRVGKE